MMNDAYLCKSVRSVGGNCLSSYERIFISRFLENNGQSESENRKTGIFTRLHLHALPPSCFEPRVLARGLVTIKGEVALTSPLS